MATTKKSQAPWKRPAPAGRRRTRLTAASKRNARASAKRGGRRYPSLVDNMNAAKRQKKVASAGSASRKRKPSAARKRASSSSPGRKGQPRAKDGQKRRARA